MQAAQCAQGLDVQPAPREGLTNHPKVEVETHDLVHGWRRPVVDVVTAPITTGWEWQPSAVEPKVISASGFDSLMAHSLHSYPPSDLGFQARWARLVAMNSLPATENPW